MGITALGTVAGSILASRVPLRSALNVLPLGVVMGLTVLLMPWIDASWTITVFNITLPGQPTFF